MLGPACHCGVDGLSRFQFPYSAHQIAEQRLPQFIDPAEAARERLLVSGVLEALKLPVLPQVDLVRVDRTAEKYSIAGFPAATNWSISSTVPDSATPVLVPIFVQNMPTKMSLSPDKLVG